MSEKTNTDYGKNPLRIDEQAFETIYNLYWEKVYAVCYNNIREIEPAKEMVQDIFKSLWERRDELELEKVSNYLIRSAKFKTFEYIRNKVSRQKHVTIKMQYSCSSSNCTEEDVLFNNLKEKVNILVDTLPCQCKRVYKMSREQGLSNKEIASALLITERAVEYHITKAMSVLKIKLAPYNN
ncbi:MULTISPECIES: sigma-70 family RNA polymerase sigma factor [Pedobacter]|uniref:sigma-70 family RNA polymerase sigma factor n=1 Tax=Pedobacter TaxID=84567 RepID=UPI001565E98A|nr:MULTISPECIES: sigma-70 family RNA polymerase sigma factor [Pedobacter]NRF38593.1 sigma-70 family RNA polymerase sigma factor [Pedobacter foliorum]